MNYEIRERIIESNRFGQNETLQCSDMKVYLVAGAGGLSIRETLEEQSAVDLQNEPESILPVSLTSLISPQKSSLFLRLLQWIVRVLTQMLLHPRDGHSFLSWFGRTREGWPFLCTQNQGATRARQRDLYRLLDRHVSLPCQFRWS